MSVMNDFVMEETIIRNFPILGGVRLFSTYLSLLFIPVRTWAPYTFLCTNP